MPSYSFSVSERVWGKMAFLLVLFDVAQESAQCLNPANGAYNMAWAAAQRKSDIGWFLCSSFRNVVLI